MKAWDFFCGAGGLTHGLLDAGIEVIAGIDIDEGCRETYEFNNPSTDFIHADIKGVTAKHLGLTRRHGMYDDVLFVGCAPCQAFSRQNKKLKRRADATLLGEFGRLVESVLPGYILVENVPGIVKVPGFSTFRRFTRMLRINGYRYVFDFLNAKHYGVPQNRRRLVLLASRLATPSFPEFTHGNNQQPFSTVRHAIGRFPVLAAGEQHPKVFNHVSPSLTELNLERLRATPHDGGGRRSWPEHLILKCHRGSYKGHSDVYGRMSWDVPAPTLTGRCISISNGRYGHPEQDRAISLREAAAIQSFPDDYRFFGSNTHIAVQIGNAVPVKLGEKLGKHTLELANS